MCILCPTSLYGRFVESFLFKELVAVVLVPLPAIRTYYKTSEVDNYDKTHTPLLMLKAEFYFIVNGF